MRKLKIINRFAALAFLACAIGFVVFAASGACDSCAVALVAVDSSLN
jgi:hypothetical protein